MKTSKMLSLLALTLTLSACGSAPQPIAQSSNVATPTKSTQNAPTVSTVTETTYCDADVLLTFTSQQDGYAMTSQKEEPSCGDGSKIYEPFKTWTPTEEQPVKGHQVVRKCNGTTLDYRLTKSGKEIATAQVKQAISCL